MAAPLLAAAGLTVERLRHTCTQLHEQHLEAERAASESLVERAEDAAAKGLAELRAQFQDVTRRNGLHGDAELATELADMMTRPSGVSVDGGVLLAYAARDLQPGDALTLYWPAEEEERKQADLPAARALRVARVLRHTGCVTFTPACAGKRSLEAPQGARSAAGPPLPEVP